MKLHAHIVSESRDCDGTYHSSRIDRPTAEEVASDFGDLEFKRRIIGDVISVIAQNGRLIVEPNRISWHEDTEEGYRTGDADWCVADCEGSVN